MRTIRDKAPPPPAAADRRADSIVKNPRKDAPVHEWIYTGCNVEVKWDTDWWHAKVKRLKPPKGGPGLEKVCVSYVGAETGLCACVYLRPCMRLCVFVSICVCVCERACVHLRPCMHECIHACNEHTSTCSCGCPNSPVHGCVRVWGYARACVCNCV